MGVEEIDTIRTAIATFNEIITAGAARHGAALVDIHRPLDTAQKRGIVVGGQRLTTDFLGGLFSMDGVHPTNTGYAIVANEFIKTLNRRFAAGLPPVAVEQVRKDDPLVFPCVGHPGGPGDDDDRESSHDRRRSCEGRRSRDRD